MQLYEQHTKRVRKSSRADFSVRIGGLVVAVLLTIQCFVIFLLMNKHIGRALNSNKLTGEIPASLGRLSKLYWLDLSENQLKGQIPVSSGLMGQGLDQLKNARHLSVFRIV